jgi:hypothetical protein
MSWFTRTRLHHNIAVSASGRISRWRLLAAAGRSKEVHMGEVVYRSQVSVTRHQGPLRTATVPAEDRPVTFGVHGAVAEHYGTDPEETEPHATTLDYLVAAAAG